MPLQFSFPVRLSLQFTKKRILSFSVCHKSRQVSNKSREDPFNWLWIARLRPRGKLNDNWARRRFLSKTNFKKEEKRCSLFNFTKLDSRVFSLKCLVVHKSGWTQENPSQSYLNDKIWYNMIWYDMEHYGMIWYLIGSQLLKLFLSWNEDSRATQFAKYLL